MPYNFGHAIAHGLFPREGAQTRLQTAALRQAGAVINAAVGVGTAAWTSYWGGPILSDAISQSADRIAGLAGDVAQVVFGKAGASAAHTAATAAVTHAQETAIQRATTGTAELIRRYTAQPGVVDIHGKGGETAETNINSNWKGRWYDLGLPPDEVFLCQRIRYVVGDAVVAINKMMAFKPHKPYGFFQHTGGVDFYPQEGEDYNLQDIGIRSETEFLTQGVGITTFLANNHGLEHVVDFSPNFIPLRSYQVWRSGNMLNELHKLELYGKAVKYLLPLEAH